MLTDLRLNSMAFGFNGSEIASLINFLFIKDLRPVRSPLFSMGGKEGGVPRSEKEKRGLT
jgi:hypothetical protein